MCGGRVGGSQPTPIPPAPVGDKNAWKRDGGKGQYAGRRTSGARAALVTGSGHATIPALGAACLMSSINIYLQISLWPAYTNKNIEKLDFLGGLWDNLRVFLLFFEMMGVSVWH